MSFPVFASGDVLNASDMNGVGLWLVKSQTVGTGVSSVTVTGAFSADYDNYLITYNGGTQSVDAAMSMQLGSATTQYFGSVIFGNYAANTVLGVGDNNTASFSYSGGGLNGACHIIVQNPFLSTQTEITARVRYATVYGIYTGHKVDSTSYTSFKLNSFGTLTGGTISVYGYRN